MVKKVLILTQNFYPVVGSAGNRMKNIFDLLNINDIDTDVLTIEPSYPNKNMYKQEKFWDDLSYKDNPKIKRISLLSNKLGSDKISRLIFYLEIMLKFSLEVVKTRKKEYSHIYVSSPPIFLLPPAIIAKKFLKDKLILEVRDLWPDSLEGVKVFDYPWLIKILRYFEKTMYNEADFIVINSPAFKKHIENIIKNKEKKIIFLPNGARLNELQLSNKKLNDNKPFSIVYAGNLGLAQNIEQLMRLINKLHAKGIVVNLIGYGLKSKKLKEFIKVNNLSNIILHKPMSRKESLNIIRNCDLSIAFLTDEEVFETVLPGKILDYMTCETPVIAGVRGEAANVILESNGGLVFKPNQIDSMINAIEELSKNDNKINELATNCRKYIAQYYIWEKNIMELIREIKGSEERGNSVD